MHRRQLRRPDGGGAEGREGEGGQGKTESGREGCETGEDQGSGEGKEEALLLVPPDQVRGDGGLIYKIAKCHATATDRGHSRQSNTTTPTPHPRQANQHVGGRCDDRV